MPSVPGGIVWMRGMDAPVREQDSKSLIISTIGEELTITGNVSSTGELHINGRIQGDVRCVALVLEESAQIDGSVVADDVMIRGRLIGSVRASRVVLQSPSHVKGDVFYKSLSIEQDTYFEGESHRSKEPLSASPESLEADSQPSLNGSLNAMNHRGSVKGFIRSLPESGSA
jgi:cytoskeletal protein CcmA (bactofilin family)